jgi:Tfp pilus assembly protein PilO
LASPLTWHFLGAALLLLLTLTLGTRFVLDWMATNDRSAGALAQKQAQLRALDLQTQPLRGLDQRVVQSRQQRIDFYQKRIPANYSSIDARIGELAVKAPVRLTRVQYTQAPPGADLTEIRLDANITGEYPHILRFVNSLERDPLFYVIRAMALTGQQGGSVSLRLQVSTWMRPADAAASGLPRTDEAPAAAPAVKEGN